MNKEIQNSEDFEISTDFNSYKSYKSSSSEYVNIIFSGIGFAFWGDNPFGALEFLRSATGVS